MKRRVAAQCPFEYFVRKVNIGHPDQCWEWKDSVGTPGYGNWFHDVPGFPKQGTAHRRAYALFKEHPGKALVLHRCGNRRCCNPDHLYAGTQKQNVQDAISHGTASLPPRAHDLTENQVNEIRQRRAAGEKGIDLAKEFNRDPSTIARINRGHHYKNA